MFQRVRLCDYQRLSRTTFVLKRNWRMAYTRDGAKVKTAQLNVFFVDLANFSKAENARKSKTFVAFIDMFLSRKMSHPWRAFLARQSRKNYPRSMKGRGWFPLDSLPENSLVVMPSTFLISRGGAIFRLLKWNAEGAVKSCSRRSARPFWAPMEKSGQQHPTSGVALAPKSIACTLP